MNALKRVARGERTTMIVIVLVAAVALALGVGGEPVNFSVYGG